MMFILHAAFFLGLIAVAGGVSLVTWSMRTEGNGVGLAKIFGVLIIFFSLLDILCLAYYGVKYWHEGYFESPTAMMQNKSMMGGSMMNGSMMNGGNMPNMMNKPQ